MILGGGKEETDGVLNFNIYENYDKNNEDLKYSYSYYKDEFPLTLKKGEELYLPAMYQKIRFVVDRIDEDDTITVESTMTFHYKEDYSDEGFKEFKIKPNESLTLYFNGQDNQGYVSVRYDK